MAPAVLGINRITEKKVVPFRERLAGHLEGARCALHRAQSDSLVQPRVEDGRPTYPERSLGKPHVPRRPATRIVAELQAAARRPASLNPSRWPPAEVRFGRFVAVRPTPASEVPQQGRRRPRKAENGLQHARRRPREVKDGLRRAKLQPSKAEDGPRRAARGSCRPPLAAAEPPYC